MLRSATACGLALLLVATFVPAGCAPKSSPAEAPNTPQAANRVEVELVDRAGFEAVLSRHKGQVVLVDCWATWCLPCVELLPHSAKLAQQHAANGFALVTLSFDDPDAAAQVVAALEKADAASAGISNLQTTLGASSQALEAFEITSGALPHFKLYDRAGKIRRVFELDPTAERQFTPADVDAAVTELLAERD
jgi:thiol-disulfide isomerase/thioredoxin